MVDLLSFLFLLPVVGWLLRLIASIGSIRITVGVTAVVAVLLLCVLRFQVLPSLRGETRRHRY